MPDNEVNVDNDALAAEAAAIALPPDTVASNAGSVGDAGGGAPPPAELQAPPASWASASPSLVFLIDRLVVPNWQLTDQERGDLADALTPVLDDLFPGGMGDAKWAPYFRLIGVGAAITLARYKDGKLAPMRAPEYAARALDEAAGDTPRGFSTSAGGGSN